MAAGAKDVREARAYLQKKGIGTRDLNPRLFANAAKETGKTFRQLANTIARLLDGGQGQGPAPSVTKDVDRLKVGEKIDYATDKDVIGQ